MRTMVQAMLITLIPTEAVQLPIRIHIHCCVLNNWQREQRPLTQTASDILSTQNTKSDRSAETNFFQSIKMKSQNMTGCRASAWFALPRFDYILYK